jgi:hypothetical protein
MIKSGFRALAHAIFGHVEGAPSLRATKKERSGLQSACDELDRQRCNSSQRIVGCMRPELGASSSSDRGLVDPQSPPLAQTHQ